MENLNTRVLFVEEMGCDIDEQRKIENETDFASFRPRFHGLSIREFPAIVDFGLCDFYYRTTNLKTGEKLKKPVREKCNRLTGDFEYWNNNGSFGDCNLMEILYKDKSKPTYKNAIQFIKLFCTSHFFGGGYKPVKTEIVRIKNFNDLYKNAGFMEKLILKNLIYIERFPANEAYQYFTLYANIGGELIHCVLRLDDLSFH